MERIWGECYRSVRRCAERRQFLRGPAIKSFEEAFAALVGARFCVAVRSGTDALALAMRALGCMEGDSAVTSAFGCPATVAAMRLAGAQERFADVEPETGLASAASMMGAMELTAARFCVPVHLFGRLAEVSPLRERADREGGYVVEDCAQVLGVPGAGRWGHAAAWSFYPTKPLGAWGHAGAVTTDSQQIADELRLLRHYGADAQTWSVQRYGWNAEMDESAAGILLSKLGRLREWSQDRARIAEAYRAMLPPDLLDGWRGPESNHIFPVRCRAGTRDGFRSALASMGVGTGIHYPIALHREPAACSGSAGDFPEADAWAAEEVSLPIWPGLRDHEVRRVAEAAARAWEQTRFSRRNVLDMPMHAG